MVERIPLFVSHAGGLASVEDGRVGLGALVTPGGSAVTSLSGLRPGPASPGLVTASGTADAFVHVAPFQAFIQGTRGTVSGTYIETLDAAKAINILSTPANATNPRNDLVVGKQTDEFYGDGTNTFTVIQVVGTPAASPVDPTVTGDYILLARVRVPANATTIVTGNITDLRPGFTVALGGELPVANQAARDALTGLYNGLTVYRQDRKWSEAYDGAAWRVQGPAIVTSIADLAAITSPLTGQLATNTADGLIYRYTGSAWVSQPAGIVAAPTTTSTNGTVTSGSTETRDAVLGNYTFTAVAGHRYRVWLTGRRMNGTVANDRYTCNIRNGGGSTPTAASTLVAFTDTIIVVTGVNGRVTFQCMGTFVPGAGTVTLGVFTVLANGTGVGMQVGTCEFYAEDLGTF